MHWTCWVKYQLRKYLCKELLREELLERLEHLDDDITVGSMRLSGMPRSSCLPSSPVERLVENREQIRNKVQAQLAELDKSSDRIESALQSLGRVEQAVIRWSFFSVDYDEQDIAANMGMDLQQLQAIRHSALGTLFDYLAPRRLGQLCTHKKAADISA